MLSESLQKQIEELQKQLEQTKEPEQTKTLELKIAMLQEQLSTAILNEADKARSDAVQAEIAKLDLTKQDYNIENTFEDILDSDGNVVGKKTVSWKVVPYDLTADEKKARAKKTEPEGATQKEIEEMDPMTHKVVICDCGMSDGSIVQMPRIVAMTEQEIEAKKSSQAKEKHGELRDKVISGEATVDEVAQFQALNSLLK